MSNINWNFLITAAMKNEREQVMLELAENGWREAELDFIADQLIALEDLDPAALPGTDRQWRDYRIQVRKWSEGAPGYPAVEHRPQRPS